MVLKRKNTQTYITTKLYTINILFHEQVVNKRGTKIRKGFLGGLCARSWAFLPGVQLKEKLDLKHCTNVLELRFTLHS